MEIHCPAFLANSSLILAETDPAWLSSFNPPNASKIFKTHSVCSSAYHVFFGTFPQSPHFWIFISVFPQVGCIPRCVSTASSFPLSPLRRRCNQHAPSLLGLTSVWQIPWKNMQKRRDCDGNEMEMRWKFDGIEMDM